MKIDWKKEANYWAQKIQEVLYLTMAKVLIDFFNALEPLPDSEDIKRWYLLCSFALMLILATINYFIRNLKTNFNHENKSFVNGYRSIDECWRHKPKTGTDI